MADNIWTATVEGIAARGRANNGAEGDYRDEEGFLCCGKCRTRKEGDITIGEKTLRVPHLCKCESEASRQREAEEKAAEFRKQCERLRKDGITDPSYPWSLTRLNFPLPPCWPNSLRNSLSKKSFAELPKARKTVTTMKKTTFKQCAAGDVFEHQGQALIKTTKPNTAVNLNSGAFAHFHDGSLVDRSDLVLIHQADLPSEMPDSLKGGRNNG